MKILNVILKYQGRIRTGISRASTIYIISVWFEIPFLCILVSAKNTDNLAIKHM